MPEGPEIRLAADRVADAIAGRPARRVSFAFPRLKRFERRLAGKQVAAVETRGKAMLIRFAGGLTIYTHNQLYGRWFVRRTGERPNTNRSLRLAIENDERQALLYSASEIDVLDEAGIAAHPFLSKLGPDVLATELRPSAIARRLAHERFRGRQLGALLLDQAFLAGIGNYLRSEMLFVAETHPQSRPADLTPAERTRLARAIRTVARRAYQKRGVTLAATHAPTRRNPPAGRRRQRHYVFARAGQACYVCGARIAKLIIGGRRCYVCPDCQVS